MAGRLTALVLSSTPRMPVLGGLLQLMSSLQ